MGKGAISQVALLCVRACVRACVRVGICVRARARVRVRLLLSACLPFETRAPHPTRRRRCCQDGRLRSAGAVPSGRVAIAAPLPRRPRPIGGPLPLSCLPRNSGLRHRRRFWLWLCSAGSSQPRASDQARDFVFVCGSVSVRTWLSKSARDSSGCSDCSDVLSVCFVWY